LFFIGRQFFASQIGNNANLRNVSNNAKTKKNVRQLLLISTAVLSLTVAYSQDSTVVKDRRFYIGASFSPDYSYRTLTKNDDTLSSASWTRIKNLEDSIYKPKYGFTTGICFGFQINKRLSIETGILYSDKGYKTVPILTIYDWSQPPAKATNIIKYVYMDIPLKANYTFLKKRLQIVVSIGAVLNRYRYSRTKTIPETPTATFKEQVYKNTYDYNSINISPTVSVGVKYKISNRINLRAEPTFRYGLLGIDDKSYASTHLWSAGLNFGFYIGL
jgi:opacity protein-like surface antigen